VRAVVALDPVDASGRCDPMLCPDVSALPPAQIPIAYLGETLDAMPRFGSQACAPAADNYTTFYATAASPTLEVTIEGAAHPSFLDDPATCGLACMACQAATTPQPTIIGIVRAVSVAWFERHLRGIAAYDTYLGGMESTRRWVDTGQARIQRR
jgi:hypothetical protein